MDETSAIARLPHLDIEIRHRRLSGEQAEQLAISLRATPSFAEFARFMDRQVLWPWAALQPWLTFAQMVQASWQPWLAASSALLRAPPPPPPTPDRRPMPQPVQAADLGDKAAEIVVQPGRDCRR